MTENYFVSTSIPNVMYDPINRWYVNTANGKVYTYTIVDEYEYIHEQELSQKSYLAKSFEEQIDVAIEAMLCIAEGLNDKTLQREAYRPPEQEIGETDTGHWEGDNTSHFLYKAPSTSQRHFVHGAGCVNRVFRTRDDRPQDIGLDPNLFSTFAKAFIQLKRRVLGGSEDIQRKRIDYFEYMVDHMLINGIFDTVDLFIDCEAYQIVKDIQIAQLEAKIRTLKSQRNRLYRKPNK